MSWGARFRSDGAGKGLTTGAWGQGDEDVSSPLGQAPLGQAPRGHRRDPRGLRRRPEPAVSGRERGFGQKPADGGGKIRQEPAIREPAGMGIGLGRRVGQPPATVNTPDAAGETLDFAFHILHQRH